MSEKYSDPMSDAFTTVKNGATFHDARPKSLIKRLYTQILPPGHCVPMNPRPCGWNW